MNLMQSLRASFAWKDVLTAGVWRYQENAVSGQRRAVRAIQGGHSPRDEHWLRRAAGHPLPGWRPEPIPPGGGGSEAEAAWSAVQELPEPTRRAIALRAHRIRAAISAGLLTHDLREAAKAGHADACDLQLLAALDRWSAGELA